MALTVKQLKHLIHNIPGDYTVFVNDPERLIPVTNVQTLKIDSVTPGKVLLDIPVKAKT